MAHANAFPLLLHPSKFGSNRRIVINPSEFFSSNSLLKLKVRTLFSSDLIKQFKNQKFHALPVVYAAQSNLLKVIQTVWKIGKDGIDAGTDLVPVSIPRPVARISVTLAFVAVALFVLKSFLSTALFVSAVMGVVYLVFIALNKDEGPKGNGGNTNVDDSLEEARRIMDKYK